MQRLGEIYGVTGEKRIVMKIKEKISTIVKEQRRADDYSLGIDFMHSFGLKCDCVGWAYINIDSEEKLELVKRMCAEAKKQKLNLRCSYTKEITDVESDWYMITPSFDLNYEFMDYDEVIHTNTIKGYKIPKGIDILSVGSGIAVSNRVMDICKEEKFTGISFVWVKDTGRYKAAPYFWMFSEEAVLNPSTGGQWLNRDSLGTRSKNEIYCRQADENGGNLTLLNEIFYSIEFASYPIMIDAEQAPKTDFAVVSIDGNWNGLIARKRVADKLLECDVIKKKELVPVLYYDREKHDLLITKYKPEKFLNQNQISKLEEEFQKFLKKKKPEYVPTEKATLALLRKAKREDKDRFEKALKKSIIQTLECTEFAAIAPYYAITNGGELSDEVDFYGYEEVGDMTNGFLEELRKEETILEELPQLDNSLVIGGTANGDTILLLTNGKILRYDHEDPTLSQEWTTVFEFFYDNLEM